MARVSECIQRWKQRVIGSLIFWNEVTVVAGAGFKTVVVAMISSMWPMVASMGEVAAPWIIQILIVGILARAYATKAALLQLLLGGMTEIRTRDTLLAYTRFPGVPLQPLEHHSRYFVALGRQLSRFASVPAFF